MGTLGSGKIWLTNLSLKDMSYLIVSKDNVVLGCPIGQLIRADAKSSERSEIRFQWLEAPFGLHCLGIRLRVEEDDMVV